MAKLDQRSKQTVAVTAALIVLAIICRVLGISGFYPRTVGLIRAGIYVSLLAAWGVSLQRRIMQRWQRRYMVAIAACMVFWFLVRTLKFHFIPEETMPDLIRMFWYCYYIPMLLIPVLALFSAVSLGKPEHYRPPRFLHLLWIPTVLLILTVLTNDLHQTVFAFPKEYPIWTDTHYSHRSVYWVVMIWILLAAIFVLGIIFHKCRLPHSKKVLWLPLVPFCLLILYGVVSVAAWPVIKPFLGDMTAVSCLLIALIFESCIQCGLIQSNSHYDELFRLSTVAAQITDGEYHVLLSSDRSGGIPVETMARTEHGPVMLSDTLRLSGAPISGGHMLWTEDVSELAAVLAQLREAKENLEDDNVLLREEYALKAREAHIREQDRLYNAMQEATRGQIELLTRLTEDFEGAQTEEERRKLLGKMVVIGAYLKRRNNLIFMADKAPQLDPEELDLTLEESFRGLELYGVSCGLTGRLGRPVDAGQMMAMADLFEEIVEQSLDSMSALTVALGREGDAVFFTINTDSAADLSGLAGPGLRVLRDEDGAWQVTLRLEGGGGL